MSVYMAQTPVWRVPKRYFAPYIREDAGRVHRELAVGLGRRCNGGGGIVRAGRYCLDLVIGQPRCLLVVGHLLHLVIGKLEELEDEQCQGDPGRGREDERGRDRPREQHDGDADRTEHHSARVPETEQHPAHASH